MAYRVLEVTIQSAKDLKRVNLLSRMEVYAVVSISGDPLTRQCTPPDPYGGRHPCWNATFRFNVPPTASSASGCLHVLLRTERALGDRDVGEVIVPLADILAGGANDPGPRPQQCVAYTVRKVHRCEPRGTLNVSFRLGPVVAPQQHQAFYPLPNYGYQLPATLSLPPATTQAYTGGHDAAVQHPRSPSTAGMVNAYNNFPVYSPAASAGGHHDGAHHQPSPINTYNNMNPAYYAQQGAAPGYPAAPLPTTKGGNDAYSQQAAAAAYAAAPLPAKGGSKHRDDGNKQLDFGVGLGAGLVSGAIGGMLASDMMAEAAAYTYGYRAGLADGGAAMSYKNSHVPTKVHDRVEPKRTTTVV